MEEVSGGRIKHARRRRRAEREAREASGGRIKLARRKRRAPGKEEGGVAGERRAGSSSAGGARLEGDSPPGIVHNGAAKGRGLVGASRMPWRRRRPALDPAEGRPVRAAGGAPAQRPCGPAVSVFWQRAGAQHGGRRAPMPELSPSARRAHRHARRPRLLAAPISVRNFHAAAHRSRRLANRTILATRSRQATNGLDAGLAPQAKGSRMVVWLPRRVLVLGDARRRVAAPFHDYFLRRLPGRRRRDCARHRADAFNGLQRRRAVAAH